MDVRAHSPKQHDAAPTPPNLLDCPRGSPEETTEILVLAFYFLTIGDRSWFALFKGYAIWAYTIGVVIPIH